MNNVVEFTPEVIMAGEKTDQDLIDEGRVIARETEQAGRTALRKTGEWYAKVQATRKLRKEEAKRTKASFFSNAEMCEAAGIAKSSATQSAQFVRAFPTDDAMQGLGVEKCLAMLPAHTYFIRESEGNDTVGQREFEGFVLKVAAGDCYLDDPDSDFHYSNPPPLEQVKRQVKILLKKELPTKSTVVDAVTKGLGNDIEEVLTNSKLTKKAQTEVKRAVKKAEKELKGKFHDEVNAAVNSAVDEQVKEAREEAEAQRRASKSTYEKYKREEKLAKNRAQGLSCLLYTSDAADEMSEV